MLFWSSWGGSGKRSPHKQAVASGFESSGFESTFVIQVMLLSMVFLKQIFGGGGSHELPLIRSTLELLQLIIESYNYICIQHQN